MNLPSLTESASQAVSVAAVVLSMFGVVEAVRKLPRFVRYREVRRFFRFSSSQRVLLICSELDEPETRQWVEQREFIYLLKYGDVWTAAGSVDSRLS